MSKEVKPEGGVLHSSHFDTAKVKILVAHEDLYLHRQQYPKRVQFTDRQYRVKGRFKKTFAIIGSAERNVALTIEASIPKFLTGQNVLGHEDLVAGAIELVEAVLARAKIDMTAKERDRIRAGNFELLRVDYANPLACGDPATAQVFMHALRKRTVAKTWAFAAYRDQTLYWGQESSRSTLKAYAKGRELTKHPMQDDVRGRKKLTEWAQDKIRFELTLRSEELRRLELRSPSAWSAAIARELLVARVEKVLPLKGKVVDLDAIKELRKSLQQRLELFLRGATDAFDRYPGARAHDKKEVLEVTGIDIDSVLAPEKQAEYFMTLRKIFQKGWGFKSNEKTFQRLKEGRGESE
jgi:hypothetical protein